MSLDITTRCTLSHINLRKEGGDDCPSTAVDLKLTGMETGIGTLALLLGAESVDEVRVSFWRDDPDKNKRFFGLGPIPVDTSVQHLRAMLGGCLLHDCTLKKLAFAPAAGGAVLLSGLLSISSIDEHALSLLAGESATAAAFRAERVVIDAWNARTGGIPGSAA